MSRTRHSLHRICIQAAILLAVFVAALPQPAPAQEIGSSPVAGTASIDLYRLFVPPTPAMQPNGRFVLSIERDGQWQPLGETKADKFLRTQTLNLPLPQGSEPVRIKIEKRGGGGAHIDSVSLNGRPPVRAEGASLKKLARDEFDVSDAVGPIVVEFRRDSGGGHIGSGHGGSASLRLTGRIENEVISQVPVQFPRANTLRIMSENSEFYSYRLGSNPGRFALDGELREEGLGRPFFSGYQPVGSGHPQAPTHGWVRDDGKTLYVAIDFTSDNTLDGGKDYAKVYVNTPAGLKAFKASVPEQRWGRPGFTYTERAAYQHKVYEFAIPLRELGLDVASASGKSLQLAFAAYGTSANNKEPNVAYNSIRNEYLAVFYFDFGFDEQIMARRIDAGGILLGPSNIPVSSLVGSFAVTFTRPAVAYDSRNNQYLVVWGEDDGTGDFDIKGRRLMATGAVAADEFIIFDFSLSTRAFNDRFTNPDVAYDSTNNRFLVVWRQEDGDQDADIWGQLVNADDSLQGTLLKISLGGTAGELDPAVDFDTVNNRFLVVWEHTGGTSGISGQLVNADGTLFDQDGNGTPELDNDAITISNEGLATASPAVAFDVANGRFLVIWEDSRTPPTNENIFGQMVNADGTLFETLSGVNFQVSDSTETSMFAISNAFNPVAGTYRIVWESNSELRIRTLNADRTFPAGAAGDSILLVTDVNQRDIVVAGNPYCGNFLAVWSNVVSLLDPVTSERGSCLPNPGLLWPNLVREPTTVTSGGTATFVVDYYSSSDTAPTQAQLWIDLDGDGAFAAAPVVPVSSGGADRPPPWRRPHSWPCWPWQACLRPCLSGAIRAPVPRWLA